MSRFGLLFFVFSLLFSGARAGASEARKTILLIGYWSPTHEMVREFSRDPALNPKGWKGENWEKQGYDVVSLFPQFASAADRIGHGDFRIDFAATYNDFMKYTAELHPVAIIAFGLDAGITGWRVETDFPNYFFKAGQTSLPSLINVKAEGPIPMSLETAKSFPSSLPTEEMMGGLETLKVEHGLSQGLAVQRGTSGSTGDYLCGFMGYLVSWYHAQHREAVDPDFCAASGFVHVGPISEQQRLETDIESVHSLLRTLILNLSIAPSIQGYKK